MDDRNDSPWEDINPPMMASAQRPAPLSPSLVPATKTEFRDELTACLVLVVPAGMDEAARREWLAVAWKTIGHLPADLLRIGCAHARKIADHPSKIVPAIMAETTDLLARRRELAKEDRTLRLPAPTTRDVMDRRGEPMSAEDTAELNERLERLGATARYRPDGTRYLIEKQAA